MATLTEASVAPSVPPGDEGDVLETLRRENTYLRRRNAQLQDDLLAVSAESQRLSQIVSRLHGRTPGNDAEPLERRPMTYLEKRLTRAADYRLRAGLATELAIASGLANVREKHEQAAARWLALAESVD